MTSPLLRSTFLHSDWSFSAASWPKPPELLGSGAIEPLPAEVPGHVHLDLMRAGVIADPFARAHELGCQWIDEEDFTYEARFEFAPDAERPKRVLSFEGLDTVCAVKLNGELLAEHDNMFVPLELDVSERLIAGTNELRIEFHSAARVGRERRRAYLSREGLPENTARFFERSFVRKAQYMFGWDWGPRLVSAGIWRPVRLLEYRSRLIDVHVRERYLDGGDVELTFESTVDGEGRAVHFLDRGHVVRDGEPLRIPRPELWWPAGLGPQHLHRVVSLLIPGSCPESERTALEAAALDRRERRLGFRRLRLLEEPDRFGRSFEFEVNGRRLWALGANWIPDDSFPARVSAARTRQALERARDLGMNMLRVWGGGLYESDAFYEAADELGLLIWQDFAYACSYYPDDRESQSVARDEARAAITRLRQHPSLALWCGNNENLTMYHDKWGGPAEHPPRYYGERLYDGVLPELLAELDPERPYIPSSPYGGEVPNGGGSGDQHYWDVWHGRGDYVFYRDSTARFSSEFGFASAPGRKAIRRILLGDAAPFEADIRHPLARFHDKTAKGYETFVGYVELHYPPAADLAEWSYYSQLNQRDALRFAIEHYRRSEFCKGSLIWQLNDCWPAQSWAVIDGEGVYKAAAYELRRLHAPLLLSIERGEESASLWLVLDNVAQGRTGKAVLEARSVTTGKLLGRWTAEAAVQPGERRLVIEAALTAFNPAETLLVGRFGEARTVALLAEPKEVRPRAPRLEADVAANSVVLESDVPVIDLFVWDEDDAIAFDDNYVTLHEPGRVTLRTHGGVAGRLFARSLAGPHQVVIRPSERAHK